MDRKSFTKALVSKLYPMLRAEGFKGSGTTLRRENAPVIHVFNIQGSRGASGFYLNLGVHLSFLPTEGGGEVVSAKLMEYQCSFRSRFEPPAGPQFAWSYGRDTAEMNETITFICDHWSIYAKPFFERYERYPSSFETLLHEIDLKTAHPRELLKFARIAHQLRQGDRCQAFAEEGMNRCPERATGLRAHLLELLES